MARAIVFVLDSAGIGGAPDAEKYGDAGADTLGHIAEAFAREPLLRTGNRSGPLHIPNMAALGISLAHQIATGQPLAGIEVAPVTGFHGAACEISSGKDTPSGHWEIAGVPVLFDWTCFPDTVPAFPGALTDRIIAEGGLPGILGNCHASGTEIVERLGEEHMTTGKPIVYTSQDSVIQIAAHEETFGLETLYRLCILVRHLVDPMNVGRVIARPFTGTPARGLTRTANRKDYTVPPHEPTLPDRLTECGREVLAIGKIGDIFAHRGITEVRKGKGNMEMFDAALAAMADCGDGGLVFANFVDFDTEYGHRRDIAGYAGALEEFDRRLPEAAELLRDGDMLILTADHGNDPSWRGTDHTRETIPVVGTGPGIKPVSVGKRATFSDIGATVAEHLGIPAGRHGTSFLQLIAPDA